MARAPSTCRWSPRSCGWTTPSSSAGWKAPPRAGTTCSPSPRSRTSRASSTPWSGSRRPRPAAGTSSSTPRPSCPRNRLDLGRWHPDFVALSFYKMFGYPTGVGALVARKPALAKLHRPWFAGGTINVASVQADRFVPAPGAAGFEDGTLDFAGIPALELGLEQVESVGIDLIHERVRLLCGWLLEELLALHHGNGCPLVRLYGPRTTERRGGTLAMNFYDASGHVDRPRAGRALGRGPRDLAAHRLLLQPGRGRDGPRPDAPGDRDLLCRRRLPHDLRRTFATASILTRQARSACRWAWLATSPTCSPSGSTPRACWSRDPPPQGSRCSRRKSSVWRMICRDRASSSSMARAPEESAPPASGLPSSSGFRAGDGCPTRPACPARPAASASSLPS